MAAELVVAADLIDVKLRRDCIVAVMQRRTIVYSMATLETFACYDSFDNTNGVTAISLEPSSFILAMPQ